MIFWPFLHCSFARYIKVNTSSVTWIIKASSLTRMCRKKNINRSYGTYPTTKITTVCIAFVYSSENYRFEWKIVSLILATCHVCMRVYIASIIYCSLVPPLDFWSLLPNWLDFVPDHSGICLICRDFNRRVGCYSGVTKKKVCQTKFWIWIRPNWSFGI